MASMLLCFSACAETSTLANRPSTARATTNFEYHRRMRGVRFGFAFSFILDGLKRRAAKRPKLPAPEQVGPIVDADHPTLLRQECPMFFGIPDGLRTGG